MIWLSKEQLFGQLWFVNSIRGNPYRRNLLDDILEFFDTTFLRNFKSYWVCISEGVTQKITLSWYLSLAIVIQHIASWIWVMVYWSRLSIPSNVLLMLHNNSIGPTHEYCSLHVNIVETSSSFFICKEWKKDCWPASMDGCQ